MDKSIDHIGWLNDYEYYIKRGSIYTAHKSDCIEIGVGKRFGRECYSIHQLESVKAFIATGVWPTGNQLSMV